MPNGHLNLPSHDFAGCGEGVGTDTSIDPGRSGGPSLSTSRDCPNPRKRARKESSKAEDGGDKKRGRGRPRLNANEETAVERRRTQIRLAQRAYRNRKETTISALERQVRDLLETNEEMSNAFTALQDFASSRGLLDQVPELGAQLRSAAERFRALGQRPHSSGQNDDESGGKYWSKSSSPDALTATPRHPESEKDEHKYGGEGVVREAATQHGLTTPIHCHSSPERQSPGTRQQQTSPTYANPVDAAGFEIVTQPTYENASFPFLFTDDQLSSILGQNPSPLGTAPPPPRSYSSAENTFGRRLQRFALECGLRLISSPNPPPLPLVRVFGFCLPFESPDIIKSRLQQSLERQENESLNFWEFPFYNLGGAGTHFPSMPGQMIGNNGTVDVMRNNIGAGFPIGPRTKVVSESQDKLDRSQRISVPGYEGEFYDAEEVEVYLRQKGVYIMPRQDVVTAEIDVAFYETAKSGTQQQQHQQQVPSSLSQSSPGIYSEQGFARASETSDMGHFLPPIIQPGVEEAMQATTPGLAGQPLSSVSAGHLNPGMATGPAGSHEIICGGVVENTYMMPGSQYAETPNMGTPLPYTTSILMDSEMSSFTQASSFPSGRTLTTLISLDVNMFIKKLTETTTCLGRTPGFRLENVHKAFVAATIEDI